MAFHQILQWIWLLVANHLWQTTIFVLVAWMTAQLFRRLTARARYCIWVIALMKLLLPSALLVLAIERIELDVFQSSPADSPSIYIGADLFTISLQAEPGGRSGLYYALTLLWGTGATALLTRWSVQRRRLKRVLRAGREVTRGREAKAFDRARSRLLPNRRIDLMIVPGLGELGVWGVRRPVVVLPEGLADRLNDQELEAVMIHELVHVIRHDNLANTLQMFFCSIFWFYPLVWLIDRRLLEEREVICDEEVVRNAGQAQIYAAGLWKVAQFGFGWSYAGISRATGSNLLRRIKLMMDTQRRTRLSFIGRALAGTAICVLVVLAMAMASSTRSSGQGRFVAAGVFSADHSSIQSAGAQAGSEQSGQDQGEAPEQMSADLKPTILYKEKAQYTQEARDNSIEGTIVLNVVFSKDGVMRDINVVRGLPYGLTQQAIYAAQKIRFKPAEKEGKAVSVRGNLEFSFNLDKDKEK